MKAILCTKYGSPDVLRVGEVDSPSPKDVELLIKIYATSVTAGDCEFRRFDMPILLWILIRLYMGIRGPRQPVLGMEFAGVVEEVGKGVVHFKKGDAVFATTGIGFGAYAEYIRLAETAAIALKPRNLNFEQAATVPTGALNALHFIKKAQLKAGQKVLIYGASGSIGTFAVQFAKYFGAEVTAVCSDANIELMKSLGADYVIDYKQEDYAKKGPIYDVVFDALGKTSLPIAEKALTENGLYMSANPNLKHVFRAMLSRKRVFHGAVDERSEDLVFIKNLIEADKLKTVVDRTYLLEQIRDAHAYVETGRKKGNVAIIVHQLI